MADSNEAAVEKALLDATSEAITKIDVGDYQALQNAAQKFLDQVRTIADMTNRAITQSSIKNTISYIAANMRQSQAITVNALQLQHTFEQQLNDFMGRTIYLTYVRSDGSFYFYDDANIGKLYQQATRNRGRGNISATKIFEANDLQKDLNNKIQASMQKRAAVYRTAVARWSSNDTEREKNYNPSLRTFYWRLYDNHHITGYTDPIKNIGIIAEGYAGAVINENPGVDSSRIESSLEVLWSLIKQDSIPAAVKGDVVWKEDGNIQFAIKEGSFSTAMFGQYVRLAYNITQVPQLTVSELEVELPKLVRFSKATTELIESLKQTAKDEAVKVINDALT